MANSLSFFTKLTCRYIAVCLMNHMQYVGEAINLLVFKVAFAVTDADTCGVGEKISLYGRTIACAGPQIIASKGVGRGASDVYDFFRVTEFHLDQIFSTVREQILGASEIPITCSGIRTYPAFNDGYIDDLAWTTREIEKK